MPEGDTIHRAARRLDEALCGKAVRRFESSRIRPDMRPRAGTRIEAVEADGKNLLMRFSHGYTLVTHMRMTGAWHVYAPAERWRKPIGAARVVVDCGDVTAVCFAAPVVEMHATHALHRTSVVGRLGPDLCRAGADLAEAASRLATLPGAGVAIADALLDQRIASGVGNVYKSETLFACGIDPFTPASSLTDDERRALIETAARLLRQNLSAGQRTTVPGGLAVYGRAGRSCRRCGTRIRSARQGPHARATYWCPACQPARSREHVGG